jgi:glucosamine-6-phosphate deaminase
VFGLATGSTPIAVYR